MKRFILSVAALFVLCGAGSSFGQGIQTGTIRGTVTDQQGLAVPSVRVTATSSALQGPRTVVSDTAGRFVMRQLPAGTYQVKYELQGFETTTLNADLPLGGTAEQNVTLKPGTVTESVEIVSQTPPPIATPTVGINVKHDEVEALATPRTLQGIATLAPALTENAPNTNQIVINGGFAFDNSIMINGVEVKDNLFGSPDNLFVEDAIEETQVLTSGIPAEFGRFGGGVVNAITKSGGNFFSGSGRVNFTNPSWTTATPFEVSKGQSTVDAAHPNQTFRTYEGTFGGPIVKDRLWFFLSGRYRESTVPTTINVSGAVVQQVDKNKRGEIKVTGSPWLGHTITGGFFNDPRTVTNASGVQSLLIDNHSESDVNYPNWYYYTNYRGVLKNNMLVEVAYSQRHNQLGQTGPSGSNIVTDSPFLSLSCGFCIYNAPYFDATDPEDRNNWQLTGNTTKYWNLHGKHETKAGYEFFRSQDVGGNSQSPTNYVFVTDFLLDANGNPVLDATGRPTPVFVPGESETWFFPAIKGAKLNIDTQSLFLQDHWTINNRWSADLGTRFEHVNAASTGGITSVNSNRIVPRVAVSFNPDGRGRYIIHASYAQSSGGYNQNLVGKNSPVGNPPEIDALYQGPAGQGYSCTACLDPANYPINSANTTFVSDATQNVFVAPGTKSPLTHEFNLSFGESLLGGKGYAEVAYTARVMHNLIDDFQTIQGGFTDVSVNGIDAGTFTNIVFQNTSLANRQYQGVVFQGRFQIRPAGA